MTSSAFAGGLIGGKKQSRPRICFWYFRLVSGFHFWHLENQRENTRVFQLKIHVFNNHSEKKKVWWPYHVTIGDQCLIKYIEQDKPRDFLCSVTCKLSWNLIGREAVRKYLSDMGCKTEYFGCGILINQSIQSFIKIGDLELTELN